MTAREKAYAQAKEYYPKLWSVDRLARLVEFGLLTQEQYNEIRGIG